MNTSRTIPVIVITSILVLHQLSNAQTVENNGEASIITYEKEFFDRYNSVTLLDMLRIIPGVKEILDESGGDSDQNERGFGSGGDQILLNGRRLAGKSNNIDDTLSRFSASQIEKIELIRGAASGLDVQSQGLVINISTFDDSNTSTTFVQVGTRYTVDHIFQPRFLISHSGSTGGFDYSLSVAREDNGFFFTRDEQFFDANDTQTGDRFIDGNSRFLNYKFNTNLSYAFEGGAELRLNGLYEPGRSFGEELRESSNDPLNPAFWDVDNDIDNWEVGGDYSIDLGFLGQLKALFVINQNKQDGGVNRFRGNAATLFENNREISTEDDREKIFRASLTEKITEKQSLEFGSEVAINTSKRLFINSDRAAGTDPFIVNNEDNVDIKENRYDIFAHHTYNISPKLVLQSSLTTEFSKIVADNIFPNGNVDRRDTRFTYLKPRFNLRFDVDPRNQIRATVEKKVSQLDFDNFVTFFDRQSNAFNFGNTNIRPEQLWRFSTAYEHRFANDGGSLEFELFYENYTDYISKVDFTSYLDVNSNVIEADAFFALPPTPALRTLVDNGSGFASKSGNIDSAKGYGVTVQGSLRLGFVGIDDAVFGATYTYEKVEVIDQFLFDVRSFDGHSEHSISINFRHDITDLGLTYGVEAEIESDNTTHDIDFRWRRKPAAQFLAFAEYNILENLKARIELENITGVRSRSIFLRYQDQIRFGDLASRTERHTTNTQEITFLLQGTF